MTKRELERLSRQRETLVSLGFTAEEADSLRRISRTLQRWFELECGNGSGCIERDETTNAPFWRFSDGNKGFPIRDREKGARKRLSAILAQLNSRPCLVNGEFKVSDGKTLEAYIQTDPRGAALYILRPGDIPSGEDASAYYSRGICVY